MAANPQQQPRGDVDPGQRDSRRYIDLDRPSTCTRRTPCELPYRWNRVVAPFVIGEIALGGLRSPARILKELQRLPVASVATDQEDLPSALALSRCWRLNRPLIPNRLVLLEAPLLYRSAARQRQTPEPGSKACASEKVGHALLIFVRRRLEGAKMAGTFGIPDSACGRRYFARVEKLAAHSDRGDHVLHAGDDEKPLKSKSSTSYPLRRSILARPVLIK